MKKLLTAVCLFISIISFSPVYAEVSNTTTSNEETVILLVDINNDNAEKMSDLLKGIGLKKASAIVNYRQEHGPFTSVEQLMDVPGIGPSTLEKNRASIILSDNEG